MKSVRSSRRHGKRRGKFVFEIRQRLCGLCLIGKIVPEHCTTILKATLQKIYAWPWKCQISLDIPKIVIYVSIIEFYKGVAQLGADRSLRILYVRVAFVWKRLVSRPVCNGTDFSYHANSRIFVVTALFWRRTTNSSGGSVCSVSVESRKTNSTPYNSPQAYRTWSIYAKQLS